MKSEMFPISRIYDRRVSQLRNTTHLSQGSDLDLQFRSPILSVTISGVQLAQNELLMYMYSKTALKDHLQIKTTQLIGPHINCMPR